MPVAPFICVLALSAWLVNITVIDVRTRRIPNAMTAGGALTGLLIHVLSPAGDGLFLSPWGSPGVTQALLGLLAGLVIFMPLYLLRAVGAGDVKLLAMVGIWLGPKLLLGAALLTLLAGGLMALAVMLTNRSSRRALTNVRVMLTTGMVGTLPGRPGAPDASAPNHVRLPYALAVTIGTLTQVGWQLTQSLR